MAGTIIVDRIESDASYASTINVAGQITFSNTVNFGAFAGTAPVAGFYLPTTNNLAFTTASTERMRIDSAGNVGIGVTPSSWSLSGGKALELSGGSLDSFSTTYLQLAQNAYYNGTNWIYKNTAGATLYQQGASSHVWQYAASGTAGNTVTFTTGMTMDSSGNVGIGTTTPSSFDPTGKPLVVGSGSGNQGITIYAGTTGYSTVNFADGTTGTDRYSGQVSYDHTNNALLFATNTGAERMRITSVGEFLFNTTSVYSAPKMALAFSSAVNNGFVFYQSNNSTGTFINFFSNGTTQQGSIINNNNGTVNYANASDYRLKENIVDFDENGLDLISRVKVRKFNRKEYPDATITGFIAHELVEVCPQAVHGEKDAVNEDGSIKAQSVDQSYLVPFLVKAIQEQQALITSLTTRITALESK